jgi:hypothetical protein
MGCPSAHPKSAKEKFRVLLLPNSLLDVENSEIVSMGRSIITTAKQTLLAFHVY